MALFYAGTRARRTGIIKLDTIVWFFIKNTSAVLLGIILVPVTSVLIAAAVAAILGEVRPGWEYEWTRFSTNGKLMIGAGLDAIFLYVAFRLFVRSHKFVAMGLVFGTLVDFILLLSKK